MPYLTPDTAPSGTICRTIVIPDDLQWKAIVNGALSELFKPWNFEKYGSLTPQETADFFYQMWSDFHESECLVDLIIGMISPFAVAGNSLPAKWLFCDGSSILRSSYSKLFAVIGTTFGSVDGTHFTLPDMRSRLVYGTAADTQAPGATQGATTHTMVVGEMPVHHHVEQAGANAPAFITAAAGARVTISPGTASNNATPLITGDTGGGAPFSIMPPVMQFAWAIFAGD